MRPRAIALAICLVAPLACEAEDPPVPAPVEPKAGDAPPKRDVASASKPDHDRDAKSPAEPEPEPEPASARASSPGLIGMFQDAKVKAACNDLRMLRAAVEMFTAMKGECPPDLATLQTERMIDRLRDDPWDRPYQLRCTELELRSAGPDGERGTPDDVVLGATGDDCAPKAP